jgi:glycosyltransferase involved in cell wall biosynthesis
MRSTDSLMSSPSLISVILCCYNGAATLPHQLLALSEQDYTGNWELIFVDDSSTDESVAIADSFADRLPITILHTESNAGPARARNLGAVAAAGDVLLFCDHDDVADKGWVAAFAEAARVAAAFGGFLEEKLLNTSEIQEWRHATTPGRLPLALDTVPVPVSCNCGVWKEVFQEVVGFSEEYDAYRAGEDSDLFWRIQLAGYRVSYVPSAIVHYRHRNDLKGIMRQSFRYGMSTALLFRRFRHLGLRTQSKRNTLDRTVSIMRGIPKAVAMQRKRGPWLWMASYACGQMVGSLRHRVWYVE